uniref:FBA_2 domain-containing protein n=1 Tax=Caenorhabditis tropicalis TaxID=1561998 RepID=A0A1I7TUN3_9PELO
MVSSRTRRSVNSYSRITPKFRVSLAVNREPTVSLKTEHESWSFRWSGSRMGFERIVDKYYIFNTIYIYSRNQIEEWMKGYDYIRGVLRCQVETIYLDLKLFPNQDKLIIDWLISQQQSVNCMVIGSCQEECDDDLKYLMDNMKASKRLELTMTHHKEDFQLELPEGLHHLRVGHSEFIKYEQLMKLLGCSESSRHF